MPDVEIVPTAKHPVVIGRWHAAPGKQTVIVYGHYDVQPVDPLDLWDTPPFEPTVRDGLLLARGGADMKANLVTLIQAVEAIAPETGAPPVNLTFLFEGEEEIGSPNLPAMWQRARRSWPPMSRFRPTAAWAARSCRSRLFRRRVWPEFRSISRPAPPISIPVRTARRCPTPCRPLRKLAASFHTADGKVAVEGFYDDVRELSTEERAKIAAFKESDGELIAEAGVQGLGVNRVHRAGAPLGPSHGRFQRHLGRLPGRRDENRHPGSGASQDHLTNRRQPDARQDSGFARQTRRKTHA